MIQIYQAVPGSIHPVFDDIYITECGFSHINDRDYHFVRQHGRDDYHLIYMIKNELSKTYGDNIIAIEIDKRDFQYFNDKNMISISHGDLVSTVKNNQMKSVILIDLNDSSDDALCSDIIYLLEPSVIKVNRLVKNRRDFLGKLASKKVVLNKCLLSSKDISLFEREAGINSFYDIPPLNDRVRNDILIDFCEKLDLLQEEEITTNNGIFGKFTR